MAKSELTEEKLEQIFKEMTAASSPNEIVVPQSIVDKYGWEFILEVLNGEV